MKTIYVHLLEQTKENITKETIESCPAVADATALQSGCGLTVSLKDERRQLLCCASLLA